jgi:glycosyltransferase involved in cell wall biosynthesis
VYPGKNEEAVRYWALETLAAALEAFKPDIVLTINDFFATRKFAFPLSHPGSWKWVHWGTLDADPLGYDCREAMKWVDYSFYFSQFAKKEIERVFPQMNGEVIYPAVDPKVFYKLENQEEIRKEYKLDDKKVILICGRNQQRKNIPILFDALKILKERGEEIVLILASNTQTQALTGELDGYNYDDFILERDIQDRVIHPYTKTGKPISDKILNIMYNLADIQIQTSWGEGFCMPLAEGFASGLPAIGINHSAIPEVIGNRGELIEPRTYAYNPDGGRYNLTHAEDVADKIQEAFTEPKKWESYGKKAENWVTKFTPERQAKRMMKAFKKVIDEDINNIARMEYVEQD